MRNHPELPESCHSHRNLVPRPEPEGCSRSWLYKVLIPRYQGDYDGDFNRAIETANRLSEIDLLYIDDTPGLSLAQIVSESRRIKREKGCVGMILVD